MAKRGLGEYWTGDKMPVVTSHTAARIEERVGAKGKSATETARRAFYRGITHKETRGKLHRYLSWVFLKEKKANNLRIWGNAVYLFASETLLTVLPLPHEFEAVCAKIRRRKEEAK